MSRHAFGRGTANIYPPQLCPCFNCAQEVSARVVAASRAAARNLLVKRSQVVTLLPAVDLLCTVHPTYPKPLTAMELPARREEVPSRLVGFPDNPVWLCSVLFVPELSFVAGMYLSNGRHKVEV